jgi:nicotinamide riboside kinase
MKVINIFAGPGSGKSTTAVSLFAELKKMNKKVEYVSEFAKDLTYEKSFNTLDDYLYIFAQQHHMLLRLKDQVDYAICDGSFLLGYVFYKNNCIYDEKLFKRMLVDVFNKYENMNYFLKRADIQYQDYGRNESFTQAKAIDKEILTMLKKENISYQTLNTKTSTSEILKHIN